MLPILVMFALVVMLSILYLHSQSMLRQAYRREDRLRRVIETHLNPAPPPDGK